MKKYLITEQDIERLRINLDSSGDNDWWYISQLDNWEKELKTEIKNEKELVAFLKLVLPMLKEEIKSYPNKIYRNSLYKSIEYYIPRIEKIIDNHGNRNI